MKNYEKYADEIRGYNDIEFCKDFVKPYILKSDECAGIECIRCAMLQMLWLMEEYEEPETDWSKVAVDTPILVKNVEQEHWYKRYFAGYKNGKVSAWVNGATSWTALDEDDDYTWNYAKLAEGEDE